MPRTLLSPWAVVIEIFERYNKALSIVGFVWLLCTLYKLTTSISAFLFSPSALYRYKKTKNGNAAWALVTGASDGIGRGFAAELCDRGINVIIHGRNEQKLEGVKQELLKVWPEREIRTMVFDAGKETSNEEKLLAVIEEFKDLELKVLVNNVGGDGGVKPFFAPLATVTSDDLARLMDLNARFAVQLMRLLLPQLARNQPSAIVNISSAAAEFSIPYASIYSGSKAFNKAWSRSLQGEMLAEGLDIEVKTILVGFVATKLAGRKSSFFVPTPREMAKSSLDALGRPETELWAFWPHALRAAIAGYLPSWLTMRLTISLAISERKKEYMEAKQT